MSVSMAESRPDDAELEGCGVDLTPYALEEGTEDLFVLFAEALDPNSPVTVEEVEALWRATS